MREFGRNPHFRMFEGARTERLAWTEDLQKFDAFMEREPGKRVAWFLYDGEEWIECGATPHHVQLKKEELLQQEAAE